MWIHTLKLFIRCTHIKINTHKPLGCLLQNVRGKENYRWNREWSHGVAESALRQPFNMECTIYMGEEDVKRQVPNVFRMELFGSFTHISLHQCVSPFFVHGQSTSMIPLYPSALPWDPTLSPRKLFVTSKVLFDLVPNNSTVNWQGKIWPEFLAACVGGGSNAIGPFHPFVEDESSYMELKRQTWCGYRASRSHLWPRVAPGILHGSLHGCVLRCLWDKF